LKVVTEKVATSHDSKEEVRRKKTYNSEVIASQQHNPYAETIAIVIFTIMVFSY